jgi:hypothetical protein
MVDSSRRADAVANEKPARDSIEAKVRGYRLLDHRIQPQRSMAPKAKLVDVAMNSTDFMLEPPPHSYYG